MITQIDRTNSGVVVGVFNNQYIATHDAKVQSLDVLHVIKTSIRRSKGLTSRMHPLYVGAVETKWAIERANEVAMLQCIIGINFERDNLVQHGSVALRATDVSPPLRSTGSITALSLALPKRSSTSPTRRPKSILCGSFK